MPPFFDPDPLSHPRPPIYIVGVNEYMCRLAGELCDGFHVHPFHSIKYHDEVILPNLTKGLGKAGRSRKDITLSSTVFVITGADRDEVEQAKAPVKQQIAFYASTSAYRGVLEAHGWGEVGHRLTARSKRGEWAGMADEITDEMLDVYAVVGTSDEIVERVKQRNTRYLDRFAFYIPFATADHTLWRNIVKASNG